MTRWLILLLPKLELLMERILQRHQAIFQGLGGSFDVYTGHVQRAPKWWVEHNLEFAYPQPTFVLNRIYEIMKENGITDNRRESI